MKTPVTRIRLPKRWKSMGKKYFPETWSTVREKILERDNHCCQLCGSPKELEVHHIFPRSQAWYGDPIHAPVNLITLCRCCHSWVHGEKRKTGEIFMPVSTGCSCYQKRIV